MLKQNMVKTSDNAAWYTSSFENVDVQNYLENTTSNAVVLNDNIVPSSDNTFDIGTLTKQWKDEYCKKLITDTVSMSSTNYIIYSNFQYTYISPDTLDPLDPPLLFLPSLVPPAVPTNTYDGGYSVANGNMIKFPSRGLYLIQFDLSWDTTKFVPIPSGDLEFRLTDTISSRFANDVMSAGFMYIVPTPIFSIPLFFNSSMPIRFEVFWLCLDTNERVKATLKSNESIFGLQIGQTGNFILTFNNFSITRMMAFH